MSVTDPALRALDVDEAIEKALLYVFQLSNKDYRTFQTALSESAFVRALEQDGYTVTALAAAEAAPLDCYLEQEHGIESRCPAAEAAPLDPDEPCARCGTWRRFHGFGEIQGPEYSRDHAWTAEAAPLDVETVKAALVVLPPPENMDAYAEEVTARLNAALRSPDTETNR